MESTLDRKSNRLWCSFISRKTILTLLCQQRLREFRRNPKLKIEINFQFLFLGEEFINRAQSRWQKYPEGAGRGNVWLCSPVPSGLGATLRALRSRAMFGVFSVVVSLLSLWPAERYWTFHVRERIFDFAWWRLTYQYRDFVERSRQLQNDWFRSSLFCSFPA